MGDARGEGRGDVPAVVWMGLAFGVGLTVLAALGALGGGLSLPALFVSLSATMMVLAFFALWQSLRGVFGGGPEAFGSTHLGLPERGALLEEKDHLLRAIKDIAFEREVGKISDEDFGRLDRAYRQRAKEVLWQLDQDLAPYMGEAQRLIAVELGEEDQGPYRGGETRKRKKGGKKAGRTSRKKPPPGVECARCGTQNDRDADHCKECGARLRPVACPSCGTENDPDAKFCKSCATSLVKPEPEARVGASAATAAEPADADSDATAASAAEPADADSDTTAASDPGSDQDAELETDAETDTDSDEDRTR